MPSLKEIRSRIRSVENIKQITKSMEMVAAARLQRALAKADLSKSFLSAMEKMLHNLLLSTNVDSHPLLTQKKQSPTAIIVAGADRGLCGAYNSTLFATVDKFLKAAPKEQIELILFGKKAIDYYSRKPWPIGQKIPDWGGKISTQTIRTFAEGLINDFLSGKYGSIRVIYTDYRTALTRAVVNKPFLPIEKIKDSKAPAEQYIFEPTEEEALAELLPRYCIAQAQNMLNQAYVSELSARVFAMRAATKNAEEMIDKMTLIRNKVRQAGITKEMLEIATGAEAMK